jgi:hypothetical protein
MKRQEPKTKNVIMNKCQDNSTFFRIKLIYLIVLHMSMLKNIETYIITLWKLKGVPKKMHDHTFCVIATTHKVCQKIFLIFTKLEQKKQKVKQNDVFILGHPVQGVIKK